MIAYTERCAPEPYQKLIQGEVEVEQYLDMIKIVGNNRFEKIPDDVPVKVYYDFDYKLKVEDEDYPELFNLETAKWILKRILIILNLWWKNATNINPIFNVMQSHRPEKVDIFGQIKPPKYSFHIIITNITATKKIQKYLLVNNINPALNEVSNVKEHLFMVEEKECEKILDIAVYGNGNQKLRSVNAVKDDEPQRPLLIMSIDELSNLPIIDDIKIKDADTVNLQFSENIIDTIVSYADNLHFHNIEMSEKNVNYEANKNFNLSVNANILEEKYLDYANIIDKKLIATHCGMRLNRFKFIKASKNIGISFDIVYSVLRDAPCNDRDENNNTYNQEDKLGANKVGWTTILKLAEQSNSQKKKELDDKWKRKKASYYIQYVLFRPSDHRIAAAFLELCLKKNGKPIAYQVSPTAEKKWFMFCPSQTGNNYKWEFCDNEIRNKIATEFVAFFEDYKTPFNQSLKELNDEEESLQQSISVLKKKDKDKQSELDAKLTAVTDKITDLTKKIKQISDLIYKFESVATKNNIMRELADLCYTKDFLVNLDSNPFILCCANGVIDLETKQFRPANPSDLCSKSTNINYITNHSEEIMDEIDNWFQQVFRNDEQRRYMYEHLASFLYGKNINQTFSFYNGEGSNGKSLLVKLMENVLGDYFQPIPVAVVTERTSIGGTSSEIYALKGARLAVMQEPEKGMKLKEGVMKQLTGNDTITAREVFLPSVKFTPFFSLLVCCNHFFNIFSDDGGTWRRIKVIQFQTLFKDKNEKDPKTNLPYVIDNETVWLKDKSLEQKLSKWKEAMLYKLVQIAFATNGIVEDCKMVTDDTDKYRHSQNRIGQFIEEKIIFNPTEGETTIRKKDLSEELKIWYEVTLGIKTSRPKELFDELIKKNVECINDVFVGIQCRRHFDVTEIGVIQTREEQFVEKFNQYYEITNNDKDFVLTQVIEEWAKELKLKICSSKAINEVLETNLHMPSENRKQKRVEDTKSPDDKKVIKYVWVGIKKRDNPNILDDTAVKNVTVKINNVSISDKVESENEEDGRPRTGGASMSAKSTPIIKGGGSISTKSTPIISDNNGCAKCGIEIVCKCKNPNYKMHTVTKQQMCMNCKCWKCECEDEVVYEVKINGKLYYVENEKDGLIYEIISDGEVGDEVGKYENGMPNFY